MSDDGWGDDDAGWTNGDTTEAPATGDGTEEVEEEGKSKGGEGDGKRKKVSSFICVKVKYLY